MSVGLKLPDFIFTSIRLSHSAILPEIRPSYFGDCKSKQTLFKFSALLKWAVTGRSTLTCLAPYCHGRLYSPLIYTCSNHSSYMKVQKSERLPSSFRLSSCRYVLARQTKPGIFSSMVAVNSPLCFSFQCLNMGHRISLRSGQLFQHAFLNSLLIGAVDVGVFVKQSTMFCASS